MKTHNQKLQGCNIFFVLLLTCLQAFGYSGTVDVNLTWGGGNGSCTCRAYALQQQVPVSPSNPGGGGWGTYQTFTLGALSCSGVTNFTGHWAWTNPYDAAYGENWRIVDYNGGTPGGVIFNMPPGQPSNVVQGTIGNATSCTNLVLTNCVDSATNFTMSIKNNNPVTTAYQLIDSFGNGVCNANTVLTAGHNGYLGTTLLWNQCQGYHTADGTPEDVSNWKVYSWVGIGSHTFTDFAGCHLISGEQPMVSPFIAGGPGVGVGGAGGAGSGGGDTSGGMTNPPIVPSPTNNLYVGNTNNTIATNYSSATAAQNGVIQIGFANLIDVTRSGFGALDSDLTKISSQLGALGGSTNGGGGISDSNWIWGAYMGESNQLAGIYGALTNGSGTNGMIMGFGGLGTNYDSAEHLVHSTYSPFKGQLDGIAGGLATPGLPSGGGGALDVVIGTHTMTFDPIHDAKWGNMWSVMKQFAFWILCAAYMAKCGKDIFDIIKLMGTARGFNVPNIQGELFGFGGNWGVLAAPVILGGILAAYAIILGVAATFLSGNSSIIDTIHGNPFQGAGGSVTTGLGWLFDAYPISEAIGLTCSYLVWLFSKNSAALAFVSVIKMLLGA